jgi:hypothetical protein
MLNLDKVGKKKQKRKGVGIWKTLKGVSHIPTPQTTITRIISLVKNLTSLS